MNVSCIICSDQLQTSAEIYVTQCGHMFHYSCLIQWLERSKSCPQCRFKTTEKSIHRVYFNVTNTDHIQDDAATLQYKLDNALFQNRLKDKDIQILNEKYKKIKKQNLGLRAEVGELENKQKVDDSVKHALKDQLTFFKSKSKENDRLCEEISKLKNKLKEVESVHVAISGTREEVNNMLINENNIESLAILAATLKKTLIEAEKKKRDAEYKLKHAQNDATKYRRDVAALEAANKELRRELENSRHSWDQEKHVLRKKLLEMSDRTGASPNTSVKRLITESPAPARKKLHLDKSPELTHTKSPDAKPNTDSDYLQVKVNNIGFNLVAGLPTTVSKSSGDHKFSLFKSGQSTSIKVSKSDGVVYNGLGGCSKEDVFPSPKPAPVTLKRHRSSILSAKYRKMAPLPAKK